MPVGFNSPARNLFLLGSSGQQVVTNFFETIDKSSTTDGVFVPDEIKYIATNKKYALAGSAADSNSKSFGWLERQDYDLETESLTTDYSNRIESTQAGVNTTLRAMELDVNDNLIVVGKTGTVPWIARYSNDGVLDWSSTTNSADVAYLDVASDSNGKYYACGRTPLTSTGATDTQAFVESFDTNGNPGWGKQAFMLGREVTARAIDANDRGHVVAAGFLEDDTRDKGYIVKINTTSGDVMWDRTLTNPDGDMRCTDVFIDSKDQIYVIGNDSTHGYLLKYSAEGNMIWQKKTNQSSGTLINLRVQSDGETEQTIVFGRYEINGDQSGILSKYAKDGRLVFRRMMTSSNNNSDTFSSLCLDADPSFYYFMYTDQAFDGLAGTPDRYTFGKVSSSGNGLGDFQYTEGTGTTIDYEILNEGDVIGRLSDGSVRNDTSDLIAYPFNANKLLFDDLATQVTNKRRQMDGPDSFEYSGSPAIRIADFQELDIGGESFDTTEFVDGLPTGQAEYTTAGTFSWTAPTDVTSVCAVCVGPGGNGGSNSGGDGGGGLGWKNNISVTPGQSYTVVVGAAGSGTASYFINNSTVSGNAGNNGTNSSAVGGGGFTGDGGGNGGQGGSPGSGCGAGGGAGGYSGAGGDGGTGTSGSAVGAGSNGSGGGGGGGAGSGHEGGAGGGVGIYGEGTSGSGATTNQKHPSLALYYGHSGSGGSGGTPSTNNTIAIGTYGGGGGGGNGIGPGGGAVRIIWGEGRSFPSTLTADQTPGPGGLVEQTVTKVRDKSGKGNNGIVNGATLNAAGYWEFDGSDDEVTIDTFPDLSNVTVEWWGTSNNPAASYKTPVMKTTNNSWTDGFGFYQYQGTLAFWINAWNGGQSVTTSETTFGFTHWVGTYDGSNLKLYKNGSLVTTGAAYSTAMTNPNVSLDIGHSKGNYNWTGSIGQVRIYPRALTEAQVFQNYNATKSKYIIEAPDVAPKISDSSIVYNSNLILNYDFRNRGTYDNVNNLLPYSADIRDSQTNWARAGVNIVSTDLKGPFGESGVVGLVEQTNNGQHTLFDDMPYVYNEAMRTSSCWIKPGTRSYAEMFVNGAGVSGTQTGAIRFNFNDGTATNVGSTTPDYIFTEGPDGWWFCGIRSIIESTAIPGNPGTYRFHVRPATASTGDYQGDDTAPAIYIIHPQVSKDSNLSSQLSQTIRYVPTYNGAIEATTVKNLSSSSYTGTLNGPTFNTDGSFQFDGTNDDITTGLSWTPANQFSFTMWFRLDQLKDFQSLVDLFNNTSFRNFQLFVESDGDLRVYWGDTSGTSAITSTAATTWYYAAFSCNGETGTLYRYGNGTTDSVAVSASAGAYSVKPLVLGKRGDDDANSFLDGKIGEFQFYNTELSSAQILQNYNATRGKYGV